jgi:cold shock protein
MTNHGRSRKTRGRGFDDDFGGSDRSPFNDRPSFGDRGSFDRAPSMDAPRFGSGPPAGFGPEVGAAVKWFNPEKGFGFVELSDGSGDVFLHINALSTSGHQTVSPGATLRVRVGQGQKGRQVTEVLSVDESTASAGGPARGPAGARPMSGGAGPRRGPSPGTGVEMRGTVKMYNAIKGFGFVAVPDAEKDVFVHASVLQRNGLTALTEGQTVMVEVVQGAKGPEAVAVRLN